MKVLVADKLPASALEALTTAGFDVVSEPALKDDALTSKIAETGAEILIVRSTKVPRAALVAGSLGLVVRAGAGYNNVDVTAASQLGIYVANCPGKNAIAVAELAWGLIISLDRRIPDCVRELREKKWNKKGFAKARGLYGRTLGVVGLGAIGCHVVRRGQAFGMNIVACEAMMPERAEELGIELLGSPAAVAARADVVTIHMALNDATRGSIGAEFFAALKPGALFVNTSRGPVVDGEALAKAIAEKGIRAGLDVWNVQPSTSTAEFADPLGELDAVYGTHHIGASTDQAQEAVAEEALRVARVYKETGEVSNCVNLSDGAPTPAALIVRHRDQVGVLASVLDKLKEAEINVQGMQNILFEGEGAAACATIHLSKAPGAGLLEAICTQEHIIEARVAT